MPVRSVVSKVKSRIIPFVDLGAGSEIERIKRVAPHFKGRLLEAIDLLPVRVVVPGNVIYTQGDALNRLNRLRAEGVKVRVINAENFFHEQSAIKNNLRFSSGFAKCQALINEPIDPEILESIKEVLAPNGKMLITTLKWHADPLVEKLKQAGFRVSMRPITDEEAQKGPYTTRETHKMWQNGELFHFFGKPGWRLQRIVAEKKAEQ